MKKCKSCQQEIDSKASKCPHCQTDQRSWLRRHKILTGIAAIIGFIVLLGIIAGASGGGGSNTSSDAADDKNKETVHALNQDVASGDVMWKVTNVRDRGTSLLAKDSRFPSIAKTKTTAGRYIEVTFAIENKGKDLASITSPKIVDGQNREFTQSTDTSEWIPEDKDLFLLMNIQPNLPKDFIVLYELPPGAIGLKAKVGVYEPQLIDLGL